MSAMALPCVHLVQLFWLHGMVLPRGTRCNFLVAYAYTGLVAHDALTKQALGATAQVAHAIQVWWVRCSLTRPVHGATFLSACASPGLVAQVAVTEQALGVFLVACAYT